MRGGDCSCFCLLFDECTCCCCGRRVKQQRRRRRHLSSCISTALTTRDDSERVSCCCWRVRGEKERRTDEGSGRLTVCLCACMVLWPQIRDRKEGRETGCPGERGRGAESQRQREMQVRGKVRVKEDSIIVERATQAHSMSQSLSQSDCKQCVRHHSCFPCHRWRLLFHILKPNLMMHLAFNQSSLKSLR